jgi:multidrug efflux pump subunit AcrA (membrane-fusion protein)
MPVRTLPLESEAVERVVEITGTLAGREEVTISAEVDGKVEAVVADLGDAVEAGAVLLQLDRTELRLQVAQARSEYDQALARLGIDGAALDRFDPASHTEVRRTQADLDEAARNLERGRTLVRQ